MNTPAAPSSGTSWWPVALIGGLMALAGWLWATAGIAGALFGSGWPAGGLGVAGQVVRDLPSHLADPRLAWPPAVAPTLPGPVAMYGVSLTLLTLVLGPVALVVSRWTRRTPASSDRARWAVARDLEDLVVDEDPATRTGRLTLGYAERGGQLLAAEARHSVCVFGPTGSGKTLSVVEPALLEWTGPAVVTSVKADVLEATERHRKTLGPCYVYDPTGSTGRPCSTWSPLSSCSSWTGASQMAGWLTSAAGTASSGDGSHERFWTPLGRKLLAPLLLAAGAMDLGMSDVVRWVDRQEADEVRAILEDIGVDPAIDAFEASLARPGDTKGSVYATVEAVLDVYTDPQVAASADSCQIDPQHLLDAGGTLYLVAPTHAQDRLRPLFEALVMSVVREAQNRAQAGRCLDPGLLLLLDEAGNVAPLRDLPTIASTGRAQGIQVVSVWQDLAQVTDRYGRLSATVVNNHRAKLALSGITDLSTLDYVSRLLGDAEVDRTTITAQAGGGTATSTSTQQQRLAPADALRQLRLGEGVLVYGALPAARLKLRRADRGTLQAARGDGPSWSEPGPLRRC